MTTGPGFATRASTAVLALQRVVDLADRLGVCLGPEALDLVEGELGAGGDDQIVVVERAAVVQLDAARRRVRARFAPCG